MPGCRPGHAAEPRRHAGLLETVWKLETGHRPVRFGEKDTKEALLELGRQMIEVLCAHNDPSAAVLAVEAPFRVPLIDPETGEILDRDLVGTLDRLEKDAGPAEFDPITQ